MASPAFQTEPQILALSRTDFPPNHADVDRNDGLAVSLLQYLRTIYEPDCEYIDGHLEERNLGEFDHGNLQTEIAFLFRLNSASWQVKVVVEVRLQVKPSRFRIPDVMVLHPGQKQSQIIREAPLLCVEVLSPEDTWKRLRERVDDYLQLGVQHIWAIDPSTRQAYLCDSDGFHRVATTSISIPNTPISIDVAGLFAILDGR